jgi:hypothetical protein
MIRILSIFIVLGISIAATAAMQSDTDTSPSNTELVMAPTSNEIATSAKFTDITATSRGQARLGETQEAFEATRAGGTRTTQPLRVYRYNDDNDLVIVAPLVSAASSFSLQWNLVGDLCLNVSYSSFGEFHTCWHIYKLINETDNTKDYYAFRHFGTAGPTTSGAHLTDAWLDSRKHSNGPSMAWLDWNPGADVTSGCSSVTVSVSALGIGLSTPAFTRCETWDITKGAAGGSFKNDWNGSVQADRQVAYQTAISVAQGASPIWGLAFSHTTCKLTWTWQCSTAP